MILRIPLIIVERRNSLDDHYIKMMKEDIDRLGVEINRLKNIVFGKHTEKLFKVWKKATRQNSTNATDFKKNVRSLAKEESAIKEKIKIQNDPSTIDRIVTLESARNKFKHNLQKYLYAQSCNESKRGAAC